MPWFDSIIIWFQDPGNQNDIAVAIVSGLMLAIITGAAAFGKSAFLVLLLWKGGGRGSLESALAAYRDKLEEETFAIRHNWLKENQTLQDILVPVEIIAQDAEREVETFSVLLAQLFNEGWNDDPPRHVITGSPGSGKSVGMRLAARQAWSFKAASSDDQLVPILTTFAGFRAAGFDLTETLAESLLTRAFHAKNPADNEAFARSFVEERLDNGGLLVLVDALDELDIDDRTEAAKRLDAELKKHPQVPAIISCRTAAWHHQVSVVNPTPIEMADFTPRAVRHFVKNWRFELPKSPAELIDIIDKQAHVNFLARNPLMLTIICYLYSQPKYRLPENRAQFYEVCCRALLEEWDQAVNPERANAFDRPHKELLLGDLAYEHMCGPTPDADIHEATVLQTFARRMREMGLNQSENAKLLNEIVVNSGLLNRLPPSGLRFPHQTFLEHFAAYHLLQQESGVHSLLAHYHSDPNRWRETILLFCGLNPKMVQNTALIRTLLREHSLEFALTALVDCRVVESAAAEEVVEAAAQKMLSAPSPELIQSLGYLAANPRSANAERASAIIQAAFSRALADRSSQKDLLDTLLLAILRRPSEETANLVVDNIDRLDLRRILPEMGEAAGVLATRIIDEPDISIEKKVEWIEGLGRTGAIRVLRDLALRQELDGPLKNAVLFALAQASNTTEFWEALDDDSGPKIVRAWPYRSAVLKKWGWPFPLPASAEAREFICYMCSSLAEASTDVIDNLEVSINDRLRFFAKGLAAERTQTPMQWPELNPIDSRAGRSNWIRLKSVRWRAWLTFPRTNRNEPSKPFHVGVIVILMLGWGGLVAELMYLAIAEAVWRRSGNHGLNLYLAYGTILLICGLVTLYYLRKVEKEEWTIVVVLSMVAPHLILLGYFKETCDRKSWTYKLMFCADLVFLMFVILVWFPLSNIIWQMPMVFAVIALVLMSSLTAIWVSYRQVEKTIMPALSPSRANAFLVGALLSERST